MARHLVYHNECAAEFIDTYLGRKVFPPFAGLVVIENGTVVGAVVLNNFDKGLSIELTAAGKNAFGLREIREVARYVFVQLDCQRMTAVTEATNVRAVRALKALGFSQEGILRHRFKENDGLLFGITRDEQKAIKL